jgi:hypothetical protein
MYSEFYQVNDIVMLYLSFPAFPEDTYGEGIFTARLKSLFLKLQPELQIINT